MFKTRNVGERCTADDVRHCCEYRVAVSGQTNTRRDSTETKSGKPASELPSSEVHLRVTLVPLEFPQLRMMSSVFHRSII